MWCLIGSWWDSCGWYEGVAWSHSRPRRSAQPERPGYGDPTQYHGGQDQARTLQAIWKERKSTSRRNWWFESRMGHGEKGKVWTKEDSMSLTLKVVKTMQL